jgi:23S rRNA-/tRNA-specific pseudouridylate synthase
MARSGRCSAATGGPASSIGLDRNTTGIMLVAKSEEAHWRLARQFENRTIQKTYMSINHGVPELLSDVIDMPIGKDRYIREKQAVRKEENGGRPAVTKYEVQETFATPAGAILGDSEHPSDRKLPLPPARFSLIKLTPKTGRPISFASHTVGHRLSHGGRHHVWGGRIYPDGRACVRSTSPARIRDYVRSTPQHSRP